MAQAAPVTTTTGYTVSLSVDEAQALVDLLECVGGDPWDTRRGLAGAVSDALGDAGVYAGDTDDISGSIMFQRDDGSVW